MRRILAALAFAILSAAASAQTGGGALLRGLNLSDVPNKPLARQNLGVDTTSNVDYTAPFTNADTQTSTARLAQFILATDFTGVDKTGVSNSCTGVQNAINYAHNSLNGGLIYFPTGSYTLTNCSITLYSNVSLQGDGPFSSFLYFTGNTAGITLFATSTNVAIRQLGIYGPGAGSTVPGITGTDVNYIVFEDLRIFDFDIGIQLKRGIGTASPFSNQIVRVFANNNTTNIDLLDNANAISIYDTVVSGNPQYGIRSRGNGSVNIIGGVCQGASISCYDVDATIAGPTTHTLIGMHIESSGSTGGQIRIGATAQAQGVSVIGVAFQGNSTTDLTPINAINVDGLHVAGSAVSAGGGQYTGSADITYGTATNVAVIGNQNFTQRLSPISGRSRFSTVPIGDVPYGSLGQEVAYSTGTTTFAELVIERDITLTGIAILNGVTVGTNKRIVALYDSAGNKLANSALAGTTSAGSNTFQQIAFTAPITVYGPRRYWLLVQVDGNTDPLRIIAANTYINTFTSGTAGVFGTLPSTITPATSRAVLNGPIAYVY